MNEKHDTGSDALNAALDRLREWAECPGEMDAIEAVCDVLHAAGRESEPHEIGECPTCGGSRWPRR